MNSRLHSLALAVAMAAATAGAQAVPERVSFTGNLNSTSGPVSGNHTFVFMLYDAPTAGNVVWTEVHPTLAVTNGLVFASLGSNTSLNATVLNGAPLYLEVVVDGTTLSPRAALQSVPYAIRAGAANDTARLGGLLPSELQRRVGGACTGSTAVQAIDADGGVTCVSVSSSTGDITAVNTPAGSGLAGGGTAGDLSLSLTGCASGQLLKFSGSGWSCQADLDTTYAGLAPVSVSAGVVSLAACTSVGQLYKWSGSAWNCAIDIDTNTTYSAAANAGVFVNASNQIGLVSGCTVGQVLKAGAGGTWACAADADTNTTYSALANGGLTLNTSNEFSVNGSVVARKDVAAGTQNFGNSTFVINHTYEAVGVRVAPTGGYVFQVAGGAAADDTTGVGISLVAEQGGADGTDTNLYGASGGSLYLRSGHGGAGRGGGSSTLSTGTGGSATTDTSGGSGGDLSLSTGYGGSSSTTYAAGPGGDITLTASYGGGSSGTGAAGRGGSITLTGGNGGNPDGLGGPIVLNPGEGPTANEYGAIELGGTKPSSTVNNTPYGRVMVHVVAGDMNFTGAGDGLILKSPDGTLCRLITITNSGTMGITPIACP